MIQDNNDVSRKRQRPTLERSGSSRRRLVLTNSARQNKCRTKPLEGKVVCLTGLSPDLKEKYHGMVHQLGGRFSRNLDTSEVTHLIAQNPEGEKYQTASSVPRISIVKPGWIDETKRTGSRANEVEFALVQPTHSSPKIEPTNPDTLLSTALLSGERREIFSECTFLLLGFEDGTDEKKELSRLIRRGNGTIYWELNEDVTHFILNDNADGALYDAASSVIKHLPNEVVLVTKRWVVSSWTKNELIDPSCYKPKRTLEVPKVLKVKKQQSSNTKVSSSLFRGCTFCLVRLLPPKDCVDFDSEELESTISKCGGQMLTNKLIQALQRDKSRADFQKRPCYALCWGGDTKLVATMNPLLTQVQTEGLCNVVHTNPLWVQTAIADKRLPSTTRQLFQPMPWPMMRFDSKPKVRIAVTGFSGSERTAIVQSLGVMGATYTPNMKPDNTHLICKHAKGLKYEKALEWKIKVVRLDWLFHVAQYGDLESTTEDQFAVEHEEKENLGQEPKSPNGANLKHPNEVLESQQQNAAGL